MKKIIIIAGVCTLELLSFLKAQTVSPTGGTICDSLGQERIYNGDFNLGNTGFVSAYSFVSGCPSNINGTGSADKYDINNINSCFGGGVYDRSGGNGAVLHFGDIQGANIGKVFWEQTATVNFGKTYKLSIWVYEPNYNCNHQSVGTRFSVYINNVLIQADNVGGCGTWNNKVYTWHSASNTAALIQIKNGSPANFNLGIPGMDFTIDDISLKECIPPVCENLGGELILNGDFNSGNSSFTSGYSYLSGCPATGITFGTSGRYDITTINSCYGVLDRSGVNGNVIRFPNINGPTYAGVSFWEQSVTVSPNKNHQLSIWVYEPSGNCSFQTLGTNFDIYINGNLVQMDVVGACGSWKNKIYSWNSSGSTSAYIQIKTGSLNYFNAGQGMDFLLDDISFKQCDREDNRSKIAGIEKSGNTSKTDLMIMPNPSNGNATLKSSVNMELNITNELGQVIRTISLNDANNHTQSLTDLSEGIYFINSSSTDMLVKRKLIITK